MKKLNLKEQPTQFELYQTWIELNNYIEEKFPSYKYTDETMVSVLKHIVDRLESSVQELESKLAEPIKAYVVASEITPHLYQNK